MSVSGVRMFVTVFTFFKYTTYRKMFQMSYLNELLFKVLCQFLVRV
jgi:hypothetical protein